MIKKTIQKVKKARRTPPKKKVAKKHDIIYSSESDSDSDSYATISDDSDYEPESASDEDDDPNFPKHLADMGEGVIIHVNRNHAKTSKNKWFKQDGHVIELDEKSIKDIADMATVMFFAEWCPHCQDMKPVFEEVAENASIPCYAVDCEGYPTLSNHYNIDGFPTIMVLKKGLTPPFMVKDDSYIYPGGPNKDSLMNWILSRKTKLLNYAPTPMSKPMSYDLKSVHLKGIKQFMGIEQGDFFNGTDVKVLVPDTLEEKIKQNTPFLILFFAPWCGHCIRAKEMYIELAVQMNGQDVCAINADQYSETAEKYGVEGFPTFGMMINGTLQKYKGERTKEGLMAFMKELVHKESTKKETKKESTHSVISITSLDDLRKMDAVITMFYAPWCSHCTHFKPTFHELAKTHSIPFALVNCDELPDAKSEFGIRGFPTIHKLGMGKVLSTFSDSPRTEDTVRNWIKHS